MPPGLRTRLADLSREVKRLARGRTEGRTLLRQLLDALPVAALVADDDGGYVIANRAAVALAGVDAHALLQLAVWDLMPNLNEDKALLLWQAFLAGQEQHGEYPLLLKDGRVLRVEYAAVANVFPGLHVSLVQPQSAR